MITNGCSHTRTVWGQGYTCDYSGEWVEGSPYEEYTYKDISLGAFKCTRCGEVGYYTGLWKKFYEDGIDCPGSEGLISCIDKLGK